MVSCFYKYERISTEKSTSHSKMVIYVIDGLIKFLFIRWWWCPCLYY